jgi:AcrR family transcriptional regulator
MAEFDRDQIAAAALAIADKHGIAGFSMRSVAEALGVSPMALYHYVEDKAALAALVVDATLREVPLPPSIGKWRDDLFAMAHWMRRITLAHPYVANLRREYNVWTPAMLQMTERWLSLWQQSGLDLKAAMFAARTSSMALTGIVNEEMIFRSMALPEKKLLSGLPNVRTMFGPAPNRAEDFKALVGALIDGLHAQLAKGATKQTSMAVKHKAPKRR